MKNYKVTQNDSEVIISLPKCNSLIKLERLSDNIYNAYSTKVDENFRGKGCGTKTIEAVLDWAKKNNYKIKATCPFVKGQVKKLKLGQDICID